VSSENALPILDTIFGGVGCVTNLAIVAMMFRERRKPLHERQWWPWITAMALIAVTAFLPGISTYWFLFGREKSSPPPQMPALLFDNPKTQGTNLNTTPINQERSVGPTFTIQLAHTLESLPKPCLIKLTGPNHTELFRTIDWVTLYGHFEQGTERPICTRQYDEPIPNADDPVPPKRAADSEIVVHWNQSNPQAENLSYFLSGIGLNAKNSHALPVRSPDNLIWIDIGSGSPWRQP
jgi:hypothetical protein